MLRGALLIDAQGQICGISADFCQSLGLSRPNDDSPDCQNLLSHTPLESLRTHLQDCGETRPRVIRRLPLTLADGQIHELDFICCPLQGVHDGSRQLLLLALDISEHLQVLQQLHTREQDHLTLFEQSPVGLVLYRMDGTLVLVNPAFAQIIGRSVADTQGLSYWDITPPDYAETERQILSRLKATGRYGPYEKEYLHADGRRIPVRLQATLVERDGEPMIWAVVKDISEQKAVEQELREREELYRTLFNSASDAIFLMDGERFIDCNPKTEELFGCRREDIIDRPPYRFSPLLQPDGINSREKTRTFISAALKGEPQYFEWCHTRLDGTPFDAEVSLNRVDINGKAYLQAIVRDISTRKQNEARLIYQAHFDSLTDLPNRVLAYDRLNQGIKRAKRNGTHVALLFLDLNRFKQINDDHGHAAGDAVLIETAQRLQDTIRRQDTVARLGGDEFIIILPDLPQLQDAEAVAQKIKHALAVPITHPGQDLQVSASIGIAGFPAHGEEPEELMHLADAAMYVDKAAFHRHR